MTVYIRDIEIQGMRGVLKPLKLTLHSKGKRRSLAIFAPNATGKSAFADAVEYFFSEDGEIKRLGKSKEATGGKKSYPHIRADSEQVAQDITVSFSDSDLGPVVREVATGHKDPAPEGVSELIERAPAYRVLRQHELAEFVLDQPRERYKSIAKWLGLEAIEQVQSHLTTAAHELAEYSLDPQVGVHERSIREATEGAVTEADGHKLAEWVNETVLKEVGIEEKLAGPEEWRTIHTLLRDKQAELDKILELDKLTKTVDEIKQAIAEDEPLMQLAPEVRALAKAIRTYSLVKRQAQLAPFRDVWEAAKQVLEEEEPEACPVCKTKITETTAGSLEQLVADLERNIASLSAVTDAQSTMNEANRRLSSTVVTVRRNIEALIAKAETMVPQLDRTAWDSLCLDLEVCREGVAKAEPSLSDLPKAEQVKGKGARVKALLGRVEAKINKDIEQKRAAGGGPKCGEAAEKVKEAFEAWEDVGKLRRREEEVIAVAGELKRVRDEFNEKAQDFLNKVLADMQDDIGEIFRAVAGDEEPADLDLHLSGDKQIELLINFYEATDVPPGGYLSESRLNLLGIAIFLASVRLLNDEFPFVVLDDIVSSFDAENRLRIASMIAEKLEGFQVLLLTHDKMFFEELRELLEGRGWLFQKIERWEINSGPVMSPQATNQQEVANALRNKANAEGAAMVMRQYMEDWFGRGCEGFQARTVHKRGETATRYELGELWPAFCQRIKDIAQDGEAWLEACPGYEYLQIQNHLVTFGSHAQSDAHKSISSGDLKTLWEHFCDFKGQFECPECGMRLVYSSESKAVMCRKCKKEIALCDHVRQPNVE